MSSIGLQVNDIQMFFQMVARTGPSGKIDIEHFVEGCLAMKGGATGLDVQKLLFDATTMMENIEALEEKCIARIAEVNAIVLIILRQLQATHMRLQATHTPSQPPQALAEPPEPLDS